MVKRLEEITVDPKTVTLTKKVDAAAVGVPEAGGGSEAGDVQVPGEDRDGRAGDGARRLDGG